MNTLYEHYYYLMTETKKPKYLDFYDLEDKDLDWLVGYVNQTVRYQGKWFFVTYKKAYFFSKKAAKEAPENFIKYLYKKPIPIILKIK